MIKMETKTIEELKSEVTKCDVLVKSTIKDIWECDSTMEQLNELNAVISKQMLRHKTAIDQLDNSARELEKSWQRQQMRAEVDGYRHQLEINMQALRKANAASSQMISAKARDELLNGAVERTRKRTGTRIDKQSLVEQSSTIADDLQAVSRLLADQVSQSDMTLQSLVRSSATTTETQEEFKTMGNAIAYSRKILTKYGRREVTDKVLIFLALAFFFAVVLYVVLKRLFWKSII